MDRDVICGGCEIGQENRLSAQNEWGTNMLSRRELDRAKRRIVDLVTKSDVSLAQSELQKALRDRHLDPTDIAVAIRSVLNAGLIEFDTNFSLRAKEMRGRRVIRSGG